MKVVACCKAVPVDIGPERVQAVDGEMRTNGRELFINEGDEYALEAGLMLKREYNAEVWAVTAGSLMSQEALYLALAKGIDNVLRINGDSERPEKIAGKLIIALRDMAPDLVLTGVQSTDWMGGEVGVYIAEGLGMPVGYAVVSILAVDDTSIRVIKEIGGGRKVEEVLTLPAVLCIQSGIERLQYVSAMKKKKVRGTPVNVLDPTIAIDNLDRLRVSTVSAPESKEYAELITGERTERIAKVLEIIKKNI
jgi:electron transfer flavoprotein beta subunit